MQSLTSFIIALAMTTLVHAQAVTGSAAPTFKVKNHLGAEISNETLKGKWTVLEWTNRDCPYVKKFYSVGEMQRLQQEAIKKGVQWVTVLSSAPGKQGHLTAAEVGPFLTNTAKATPTHFLMDEAGTMGRAFGAKTTPHMFVLSPDGKVVYQGAIDDNSSSDSATIKGAKNYVMLALEQGMAQEKAKKEIKIDIAETKPYGCSVKY